MPPDADPPSRALAAAIASRPRLLLRRPHAGGSALAFRGLAGSAPRRAGPSPPWICPAISERTARCSAASRRPGGAFRRGPAPPLEAAAAPGAPPLVLLGHSLGGLVVHALVARLEASGRRIAAAVITATRPPHAAVRELSRMEDDELLESLLAWGWISSALARRPRGARGVPPRAPRRSVAADDYRGAGALPLPGAARRHRRARRRILLAPSSCAGGPARPAASRSRRSPAATSSTRPRPRRWLPGSMRPCGASVCSRRTEWLITPLISSTS